MTLFGNLLGRNDSERLARIIHELIFMAFHSDQTFGRRNGVIGVFQRHPMLLEYVPPESNTDEHKYRFGNELEPFHFLSHQDESTIQVMGYSDYKGLTITSGEKDKYIVCVADPMGTGVGKKSKALAAAFKRLFRALDTSGY